jgi:hypothetical protein
MYICETLQINPCSPITEKDTKYRKNPEKRHLMHCVVYVAKADNPSEELTDERTKEQIRIVREEIGVQRQYIS